jgi:hypothetical protein
MSDLTLPQALLILLQILNLMMSLVILRHRRAQIKQEKSQTQNH